MNIITALIEVAKDPLAGGYLYGFIAMIAGFLLQSGLLVAVGALAMLTALLVAMVIAYAE